jgi:hypothetical protein
MVVLAPWHQHQKDVPTIAAAKPAPQGFQTSPIPSHVAAAVEENQLVVTGTPQILLCAAKAGCCNPYHATGNG